MAKPHKMRRNGRNKNKEQTPPITAAEDKNK